MPCVIYVAVCACVCMQNARMCLCVHGYASIGVRGNVCVHVRMVVCVHVHLNTCAHLCACTHTRVQGDKLPCTGQRPLLEHKSMVPQVCTGIPSHSTQGLGPSVPWL